MSQTRLLSLLATLIAVPVSAQGGTACLQGRVYGAAGSPLLGARVLLLNTGAAVATDIEGRFAFPELRPDTVSVRVTYIGYKSGMVTGLPLSVGRTVLQDFTLEESKVTISETGGAPPPGMVGNAARLQPVKPLPSATKCPIAVSEYGDGSYVDKLPVDNVSRVSTGVAPGTIIPSPGRLEGTVMAEGRQPLWGARVFIVGSRASVTTDSSGRYRFEAVPAGVITVQAMAIASKSGAVAGIRIRPGELVTQDIILASAPVVENSMNRTSGTRPEVTYVDGIPNGGQAPYPNPGRLEGIVRDAANRAVVDAVVAVVGTMESARTDSTGRYVLPLVPSGVLALRVTRAGYAPTMVEGLRLRQGETILQDFHLAPAAPARP